MIHPGDKRSLSQTHKRASPRTQASFFTDNMGGGGICVFIYIINQLGGRGEMNGGKGVFIYITNQPDNK